MTDQNNDPLTKPLWVPRPIDETMQIYANWAATYDADVTNAGYATPTRIADTLKNLIAFDVPVLDFGCGTGLSGVALNAAGFTNINGVDISPEMLDLAHGTGVYSKLWQEQPGALDDVCPGDYKAIVAAGGISLGAAPPETLDLLLDNLEPDGLAALSFNDPTLADGSYDAYLNAQINAGRCALVSRTHGEHLPGKGMGSDVIVLKRL